MLPIPTTLARALFLGSALGLVGAILLGSTTGTLIAGMGLLTLAAAFFVTIPAGRAVRRERLEFAWWLAHDENDHGGGAAVPGRTFEVRCFIHQRAPRALVLRELHALTGEGVHLEEAPPHGGLAVAAASRSEFAFRFIAPAAGRVVLHGLAVRVVGPWALFEVPLYFPNPLVIKVLPQAAAKLRSSVIARGALPLERAGASRLAPGSGIDLRELREMLPTDSIRSIAWKPSARRGRLLVREVEQEVQETRCVIVDVSGTMRGGEPGQRKLDAVINAVAAEARRSLARGDAFGLMTFDGRVLANLPPTDDRGQLLRVFDALVSATEIVDSDLTEDDDEDVVAVVGRYLRHQEGIDFRTARGDWNLTLLAKHVQRMLDAERPEDLARLRDVRAGSPLFALLRRFCRLRGIPLTHRPDPLTGAKAPGFAAALKALAGSSRAPMLIALVTDLDGLGDAEPLIQTATLLRQRGHTLVLVVPDATTFHPRPRAQSEQALWDLYARGERRRLRDLRAMLVPAGASVRSLSAEASSSTGLASAIEGARRLPRP